MLEPDSWEARRFQHSFRGNWFQFWMYQTDHSNGVQTVILNLDDDAVRILKPQRNAEISLSPSGRWYVESTITEMGRSFEVQIFDTESGATPFAIDGKVWDWPCCFSSDDFYFGCSVGDVRATTRIWNVEAGTIALTIPQHVRGIGFSESHRLMAGWVDLHDSDDKPQKIEMRVWEVESGKVIHRWAPPDREDAPDYWRSGTFQFVENDAWLLYQNLSNVREGENSVHAGLDLKLAWNIETGQRVTDYRRGTVDPNMSQNGIPPASLPPAFLSFNSNMEAENLCEITSGRQFFAIPAESNTILLTRDARTLVLHEFTEYHNVFLNLLLRLDSFGIPIPNFLWSVAPRNSDDWNVVEIPSGRTMATIPKQHEICWLSPDEKTLVTASNETDGVINVWDFPPRKPVLKPLAWSQLVPMLFLGTRWKWWRRPR